MARILNIVKYQQWSGIMYFAGMAVHLDDEFP